MINFSKLNLSEGMGEATEAAVSSAEKAKAGGEKQINDTQRRRDRQKAQMAQQGHTPVKSDVSYASEGYVDSKYSPESLTKKLKDAGHGDVFLDKKKQTHGKGDDVQVPIRARDSKGKEYDTGLGYKGTTGGRHSGGDKYSPSMETGGFSKAKKTLDDIDKVRKVSDKDIKDAKDREKNTPAARMNRAMTSSIHSKGKKALADITGRGNKRNIQGKGNKAMERATRKEEYEYVSNLCKQSSDWRKELYEAAGPNDDPNHPYVDVMPFVNQKQEEVKRQMKGVAKAQGMNQAKMANEGALNPFQVHFDKDGKEYTSKGSKKSRDRIAKNISDNRKSGPLAQDPYKPRAGESD